MYSQRHPVLCDIGRNNAENRERLGCREEHFNRKKWLRFLRRKTLRDVIRYLRVVFPLYFQKKKKNKRCILNEPGDEDTFDLETHELICQSEKKSLLQILKEYRHLMPDDTIKTQVIDTWLDDLELEQVCQRMDEPPDVLYLPETGRPPQYIMYVRATAEPERVCWR